MVHSCIQVNERPVGSSVKFKVISGFWWFYFVLICLGFVFCLFVYFFLLEVLTWDTTGNSVGMEVWFCLFLFCFWFVF